MKEKIKLKYLKNEYFAIQDLLKSMNIVRDNYIPKIKEDKSAIICVDCYDLFDWLFPPGFSFHDHHYQGVHDLWCTVEEYLNPNDFVRICVPPGSAMEMFHLIKQKYDLANGTFPIKKNIFKSDSDLNERGRKLLNNYNSIKKVLSGLESDKYIEHLMSLCNNGKVISFNDIVKIQDIDSGYYNSKVGHKINYGAGFNYLLSSREKSKQGVPKAYAEFSIAIDMLNLQNSIFLNSYLNENNGHFAVMTSHGGYTLHGWKKAFMGEESNRPYSHSNTALLLTKTYKSCGDLKNFNLFLDEAINVCNRQLESLKKYPEIYNYFFQRTSSIDLDKEIYLNKETEINELYWEQNFKDFLSPNHHDVGKIWSSKDIDVAHHWAKKERLSDIEKIDLKAKEIYNKTSFLTPEMRNIFLPEDENTDEILIWLND